MPASHLDFTPYPALHGLLSAAFPQCLWLGADRPEVALTFDDGPHPEFTPPLLKVLERHGVVASFFLLGHLVRPQASLVRRMYAEGHWLGLHGYWHLPFIGSLGLQDGLGSTRRAIALAAGFPEERVVDVRPTYGFFTPGTLDWLTRHGYRPVMWHVVPEDWSQPRQTVVRRILDWTRNGSVIVLHDGPSGGHNAARTADAVIPRLQDLGYKFVSVDRLWQGLAGHHGEPPEASSGIA